MRRVDAHTFRDRVVTMTMCLKPPLGFSLHIHTISEYRQMRCFFDEPEHLGHDGGFAITETGELVNLFALKRRGVAKGHGERLLAEAIELGANRLDCYEGPLSDLYARHGFVVVERIPWDGRYAHPEWKEDLYGAPDVVVMVRP